MLRSFYCWRSHGQNFPKTNTLVNRSNGNLAPPIFCFFLACQWNAAFSSLRRMKLRALRPDIAKEKKERVTSWCASPLHVSSFAFQALHYSNTEHEAYVGMCVPSLQMLWRLRAHAAQLSASKLLSLSSTWQLFICSVNCCLAGRNDSQFLPAFSLCPFF